MEPSFIFNGQVCGDVATVLMENGFDPNVLRPYLGKDGRTYITRNGVAVPVQNATATLRKDDWINLDQAIVKAATPRLKFIGDLRARGLQYTVPNGMGSTVLQTQTVSDINDAVISMDGLKSAGGDRPEFELTNLPLPIIHKDFHYSARQIATSRSNGSPLDTTTAEMAARKVAEEAEKLALGRLATYTYGGGTVYGLTNYTSVLTKVLTNPTDSLWTPATLVAEILQMRGQSQAAYHYGPWAIYCSPNWDAFLDDDYSSQKGDLTLRERILKIDGIQSCLTLDYLQNYDLILVQTTSDIARIVVGMEITTLQWESNGGLQKNFKVMAILVPQFRKDHNGNTGIVYGKPSA